MSDSIPVESALPNALTTREQWLCWRAEKRHGKVTKVPVDPATGSFASTTNSATWSDFETAAERAQSDAVDGIGFVFTDADPIVGVDLDDCRSLETGKTREWATDIIDRLESFTEVSHSGTGYHVLVEGALPDGPNRKGDIELYETACFVTVTGEHVVGAPPTVESREAALEAVHEAYLCDDDDGSAEESNGAQPVSETDTSPESTLSDGAWIERANGAVSAEKFGRLWRGQMAGFESHSEADMALCSLLAFWTGGDASQMDRLFRESGLHREKWDEEHDADGSTYGEKTIDRAITATDGVYEPSGEQHYDETGSDVAGAEGRPYDERASARLERLDTLATMLRETIEEADRLRAELEAERERRRELETQLDRVREEAAERPRWWVFW